MNSLRWKTYPLGKRAPDFVKEVVAVFGAVWDETNSAANKLISNDALAKLQPGLSGLPRCFRTVGPLKMRVSLKERTACPPHVDVSPRSSKTSYAGR